jgi:uncharacterized damage-inducible protein DinB
MTLQDLQTLLDYNYYARDRLLAALEPLTAEEFTRTIESSFRSIRDTAVHIYAAEWIWHQRWLGQSLPLPSAGQFPNVATLRGAWLDLEAKTRAFLNSLNEDGINRIIDYKLLSGAAGSSPFWQMLQHVVNHGSYHRGQVTTMLRQVGAKPPQNVDLIGFYRHRPVASGW